jgi:hypothetical protein
MSKKGARIKAKVEWSGTDVNSLAGDLIQIQE